MLTSKSTEILAERGHKELRLSREWKIPAVKAGGRCV